jgi:1,4-dihydroxy-2-naphthoate octaprenyltransferase
VSSVNGAAMAPSGWREALNPALYLVSLLPGLVVLMHADAAARGAVLAATFAVILLQHAINVLNDVADWKLGADVEKWDSWVRVHNGTRIARWHGVLSFSAGSLLGLLVLFATHTLWILGVAAPLVMLGYLYNAGPRPLSYTQLGEWATGVCYGGVFACLWMLAGKPFGTAALAGALAFAAFAVALLLSHQPPQIATDRAAGKHSFAVRYGAERTLGVSRGLFAFALVSLAANLWLGGLQGAGTLAFGLAALAAIGNVWRRTPNPRGILLQGALAIGVGLAAHVIGAALA